MRKPKAPAAAPIVSDAQEPAFVGDSEALGLPSEPAAPTKEGNPAITPDGRVHVRSSDGTYGTLDAKDLPSAIKSGAEIVTDSELRERELQEKYGGVGGVLASTGAGAVRGMTAGLFDPAAVGIAGALGGKEARESTRQTLADLKEANPIASTLGEVGGAVAPMFLTGGASAGITAAEEGAAAARGVSALGRVAEGAGTVARTLGAPVRGIGAIGEMAGNATRAIVGTGEGAGLASRVGRAILTHGAQGAAEGALFGVGNEISEATLGDHELTAEKLLAAAGHGGMMGFGLGGAVGAGGELARGVVGRIAPALRGAAEEQAFRSINARKAFTDQAEKLPGGVKGLGRRLLDEGIIAPGDTVADIAPKVSAAREQAGKAVGDILAEADTHGVGPKLADVYKAVENNVLKDLSKLSNTNRGAIRQVERVLTDLRDLAGATKASDIEHATLGFKQAQEFRAMLDDQIKFNTNPVGPINPVAEAMKGIRRSLEDEIVKAGERLPGDVGAGFRKTYEAAKLRYRQLTIADKAATDAVSRADANASHSLTDKIFAASGLASGMASIGVPGIVAGPALGAVSRLMRTRGNSTAAVLADRISALSSVEQAAARFDRNVDRAVAGLLQPGTRAEPRLRNTPYRGETLAQGYQRRVQAVARAGSDIDAHADQVQASVARIETHAPNIAAAYQHRALLATQYLASKIPQSHVDMSPDTLNAKFEVPRVSDAEMAQFNQLFDVTDDPVKILTHVNSGRITPQMVEALEVTKPKALDEIREKVMTAVQSSNKPLPYQKRLSIATLLGPKVEPTLSRQFIGDMQRTFSNGAGKGGPGGPHGAQPMSFASPTSQSPKRPMSHASSSLSAAAFSLSKPGYGSR